MKIRQLPEFERMSVLAAMILLAYVMVRFVDLPTRTLELQFVGLFIGIELNANTIVTLLVAGLVITGVDWLIRQHPEKSETSTFQHWVLPGLTAWILGITLNALPLDLLWWMVLIVGAGLLLLVLTAEYIVVDPSEARYPLATMGLTALSFALYFILAVVLRSEQVRLVFLLPALSLPVGAINLRHLYLRLNSLNIFSTENAMNAIFASLTSTIISAQLTAALHYWPLTPVQFGLALLGAVYALNSLLGNLTEEKTFSQAWVEPAIILLAIWGIAFLFR